MTDINQNSTLAGAVGAVPPENRPAIQGDPRPTNRRVRAVIADAVRKRVLVQVNNRAEFGCLTIMLPGGGNDGEGDLTALAREIYTELGVTVQLTPANCKFIQSRAYEFPAAPDGSIDKAVLNFYGVDIGGAVPRNMEPDSVLSLDWMTLTEIHRVLDLDSSNWRIQLGALDAIEAVLDPAKAKTVHGHGGDDAREVSRQDGGVPPDEEKYSKPSRLPSGEPSGL